MFFYGRGKEKIDKLVFAVDARLERALRNDYKL